MWYDTASPASARLIYNDLSIIVQIKPIKTIRLRILADAQIYLSAPLQIDPAYILTFIQRHESWIRKKQAGVRARKASQLSLVYQNGESHCFLGKAYRLVLLKKPQGKQTCLSTTNVFIEQDQLFVCCVRSTSPDGIAKKLDFFYRQQLTGIVAKLINKWMPIIGVRVKEFAIRRKKGSWGTCYIQKRKIILNLELVHKTIPLIEYVVVHEMLHLLERYHNAHFYQLMQQFLPHWQSLKARLNEMSSVCE